MNTRHDVVYLRPDLPRPLVVDVEDHPGAAGSLAGAVDLRHGSAVEVAVDLRPLQKRAGRDEIQECIALDEVVIAAVDLVGAR